MTNERLYMTEEVYHTYEQRARRLEDLCAPELILRNEQHILDSAVLVQTDEAGWHHFPATAAPEDTVNWLDEGCGCRLFIPQYADPDGCPDTTYVDGQTLDFALTLARQDGGEHVFALYSSGFGRSVAMRLPLSALGREINDLFRVIYDAQNARCSRLPDPVTVLPGPDADGCVLAQSGVLLLRESPSEEWPAERLLRPEGVPYFARSMRGMMESYDPCLVVIPEHALPDEEPEA